MHEPSTYKEAALSPHWVQAMQAEIDALQTNHTWIEVSLPPGKRAISSKWVYKIKLKADGSLERYKVRLVIRGNTQKEGIDYTETFSPVVKMTTIRTIIALAAAIKWPLYQLDVNNAFLHGDLHEEVYMKMPEGIPNPTNKVCKLQKSLYGLEQASRQWHAKLADFLKKQGYTQSKNDYSLFLKNSAQHLTIVAVYVDDILLIGSDPTVIQELKHNLNIAFGIKDLGFLHYFLGFEVIHHHDGVSLTQRKFTQDLLKDSGHLYAKSTATPLPINCKLTPDIGVPLEDPTSYRTYLGKLNFLSNTRPDISFAVQTLSQFMQKPTSSHMAALDHLLRYIFGTAGQGILLRGADFLQLTAYSDSDWASCPISRRSVTGYVVFLGQSLISWKSKKQQTVSLSSAEAKYRSMRRLVAELAWLSRLLHELTVEDITPIPLKCDNQAAIYIAKNPVYHDRTKHIELDCHFVGKKLMEGLISLSHVSTKLQFADILTKQLPGLPHHSILGKLGISHPPI